MDPRGIKVRKIFVYGEPRPQDRHEFWKLLRRIKSCSTDPWLMAGDFNEALFQSEHYSTRRRSVRQMEDFRETLEFCNLHDLGFKGTPWTYDNKQAGRKNVRVRLDRAVGCPAWSDLYPNAIVQHVSSSRSDHCPILIELEERQQYNKNRVPRYEAMWEREPSLTECVDEAWKHYKPAANLEEIQQKLAHTMSSMDSWSSTNFGSVNRDIKNHGGGINVMLSTERLQLVSSSICSADLELIKADIGDHPSLLVATAVSMIISIDAGPELIKGNGGRLWLLVAAASMIIFLDAGLVCAPHLNL